MELPQKLTTDLRIIQNQMKLAIQTHQTMRIKQIKDPNNFKLHEDLREVEKRISSLGEKQNQLMKWLRKQLTTIPSNSALMAKTIAATLGFNVNGTLSQHKIPSSNILVPKTCNSAVCGPFNEKIQKSIPKPVLAVEKKVPDKHDVKEKTLKIDAKVASSTPDRCQNVSLNVAKTTKHSQSISNVSKNHKLTDNGKHVPEPLSVEKEQFLSAVGLVTREILKELQNKRVERKRRSTANHTQFVYGSSWEISSKKRKKNNYLASTLKQPVTRQAVRAQNHKTELPQTTQNLEDSVLVFKTPLPVLVQNQSQGVEVNNVGHSCAKTIVKNHIVLGSNESCDDRLEPSETYSKKGNEYTIAELCIVCRGQGASTVACSCSVRYHPACADKIENCLGCGIKIKSNISDSSKTKEKSPGSGRNCKKEDKTHT